MTQSTTYFGQDTNGYDYIGNDQMKVKLVPGLDLQATVAEIKRCCGRACRIYLYKGEEAENVDDNG